MNLFAAIDAFLFGRIEYETVSRYSLEESLRNIQAIVRPWSWGRALGLMPTGLYGSVSEDSIVVFRHLAVFHNSFKPYFYGALRSSGTDVTLNGVFTMTKSAKIVSLIASVLGPIIVAIALWDLHDFPQALVWLAIIAFPATFALNVCLGRWIGRNDPRIIADALDEALA